MEIKTCKYCGKKIENKNKFCNPDCYRNYRMAKTGSINFPREIEIDRFINSRYISYKTGANQRNISFDLSREEFVKFIDKDCHYCGKPVNFVGIDRINSLKGYSIDNTVSCCTHCNIIKLDVPYNTFLRKIIDIYNNLNLKDYKEVD